MKLPSEAWSEEELDQLESSQLRRQLEPLQSVQGALIEIGNQRLLNFSSNDYLGLAGHPKLIAAAASAAFRHGVGSGSSRLLVGDTPAHRQLEANLKGFLGSESALVFNSGYAANTGILSAFCQQPDVIFSDSLNHASLIDGCRLSRARTVVYPHGDLHALDRLIRTTPGRRRMVCTESVFSMDGDLAPLEGVVELCRRHQTALMVDEAHALGVIGPSGAGLCEQLGISQEVDIRVGTLGKAVGAFGAFAAASSAVTEFLVNRARSLVFSTSLPPAICAAARAGLELVASGEGRERLWENIRHFSAGLSALGLPSVPRSAIFSVVLGTPERVLQAGRELRSRGLLVKPIRPPTVPEGTSRLRFGISASHTQEQIEFALRALCSLDLSRNGPTRAQLSAAAVTL
jgi:8-amino-7-oxononanoate synthase